MPESRMPVALKFLLAARRSELVSLENLAATCALVEQVSVLVHALQKERGYSNFFLSSSRPLEQSNLAGLSQDAVRIDGILRDALDTLAHASSAAYSRARLLNSIAHALFHMDDLKRLRQQVQDRSVPAEAADLRFTQVISSLLAIVFEAADAALDPGVTQIMVALLNLMQGKEISGQERACGVIGFTAGHFTDVQKARMLGLAALQARSFDTFTQFADEALRAAWAEAESQVTPVVQMRAMAQRTTALLTTDPELAEVWFDACTARIDAMHAIEQQATRLLAQRCAQRIAEARQELEDHRLLLSRHADHASGRAPSRVFSVQSRIVDVPPEEGVGDDMTGSLLDLIQAQNIKLQRADAALAEVRGALDEKKQVARAKAILMHHYTLTEHAAHERLQRAAMDGGLSLAEVSRQIIQSTL